jgi:hypothetical protein
LCEFEQHLRGGQQDGHCPPIPDDPYIATNLRVTIALMHEQPSVPPDLKREPASIRALCGLMPVNLNARVPEICRTWAHVVGYRRTSTHVRREGPLRLGGRFFMQVLDRD